MSYNQRLSELERKFRCLNIRGVIEQIDPEMSAGGCVKVRYGENQLSDWLPVKPVRSGSACIWWFPEIGEGVTVTDIETGEVLPGSFIESLLPPSRDPDVLYIQFGDGGFLTHNKKTGVFNLNTNSQVNVNTQKATITAPTIESTGSWTHNGTMRVKDSFTVDSTSLLKGAVTMSAGFGSTGGSGGSVAGGLSVNNIQIFDHVHDYAEGTTEKMR